MTAKMNFTFSLSKPMELDSAIQRIYGLVEIQGGEIKKAQSNLGFVIDTSDSMRIRLVSEQQFSDLVKQGYAQEVMTDGIPAYQISSIPVEMIANLSRRIDFVADALKIASEILGDKDYFSLVAFASQAKSLIGQSPGTQREQLGQAAHMLETINLGDATNMDKGMELAFEEILRLPGREFASRMVLLTDGHTREVDLCYMWAKRARQAGIKISTMGIGTEFNEELLIPLADLTGGNAHYLDTPDKIGEAFRQEIRSALNISCRNMELKLHLAQGAILRSVYRILPQIGDFDHGQDQNGSYSLMLGDFDADSELALLLEFEIPFDFPDHQRLAQSVFAWDGLEDENRLSIRREVVFEIKESQSDAADKRIMAFVERVDAYRLGLEALNSAQQASQRTDKAEKGVATIHLRQAATRLLDMGEAALAGRMLQQADQLEQSGTLDSEAAKKLRYETRRLSQNL